MPADALVHDLAAALDAVPLIDPHSHIDPHAAASRSLDDILGYHYYTELAHSAGMPKAALEASPRERCRAILAHMDRFGNTAQYAWFLDICRTFLGWPGDAVTAADCDDLFDRSEKVFGRPGWLGEVFATTNLERIFLTNEFDDPLTGFDTTKFVPCLRTDALVFKLHEPAVRERLAKATGVAVGDAASLRAAVRTLFEQFTAKGAKACAISLPHDFRPWRPADYHLDNEFGPGASSEPPARGLRAAGVFWAIAEQCREFGLPFDLMVGVTRDVYPGGVHQGRDLFDRGGSLVQYRELFSQFPEVTFPVSVLTSGQNQELVAYSWIFPNVVTCGHWWYSNLPAYIRRDTAERLQGVPQTKQVGYYSDAYKLEFVLPKYRMYRRCLAGVLADEFVRPGRLTEAGAVALGTRLLRDNVRDIFKV